MRSVLLIGAVLVALHGGLLALLGVLLALDRRRVSREIDRILADARARTYRVVVPTERGTFTITLWEETWPR